MERIKFITDSACDIPIESAQELGITVLPIPITVDGVGYHERVDFTPQEFYQKLLEAKGIPATSHITAPTYAQQYAQALAEGYTHVVVVTINSGGSNMYEAATMGLSLFREEHPEAALQITLVDSRTYTMAYGYPTMEAAKMARQGRACVDIVAYLEDFFSRVEIYFAAYSLEFIKKSGRVSAAASFVGDVLGLRPIISMIDGDTKVVEKVRGDKNVVPKLAEIALQQRAPGTPMLTLRAMTDDVGEQLTELVTQQAQAPVGLFYAGASIAINAGPRLVGIVVLGQSRAK